MESREQILKKKRLTNRLHLVTTRIKDVERERIWAIANAHTEGLSIRKIAEATGLSSSRVHQGVRVVSEQLTTRLPSSFLDKTKKYLINERGMESQEQILKEKRLINRLHLATTRIKDVERERIWAIATAHSEGLSIRTIAKVTGLSSSRVHQLA
ncbi:MAG: LysM peptidoglycan-binding domain-containing protein [Pleurocapsa sp. MO_226.B13]|nr:LysM peptidoglycan-binding domain-containing protein [Pleurocapsa sp. MO_226.B13]